MLVTLMLVGACASSGNDPADLPVDDLVEATGFRLNVFAIIPGAGSLAAAPDGEAYVATSAGEIVRLEDLDDDGIADEAARLAIGLEPPVSLALDDGGHVIALVRDRVVRLAPERPQTIVPSGVLPVPAGGDRHHVAQGPDGRLYLSLGPVCEGCRTRKFAGAILDMRPDGHELGIDVHLARRPGALDWHPETRALAFADDAPGPIAREQQISGLFMVDRRPLARSTPSMPTVSLEDEEWREPVPALQWTFPRGLDPGGMDFYGGDAFPNHLTNALLVVLNPVDGSGETSKVVAVRFDRQGRPVGEETLLAGWQRRDGRAWGRPVDVEEQADGSVLISDELAGVVYRLAYEP